jgi:hypothetical protein
MQDEEIQAAIDAGVIPADAVQAYRLGLEHGCKAAAGDSHDGACWSCGKPRSMPSHEEQTRDLAAQHYLHSAPWHWSPMEFQVLRELLDAEGPGAYLDAIVSRRPFYGSVRIVKPDRTVIDILRRDLLRRVKEKESSS